MKCSSLVAVYTCAWVKPTVQTWPPHEISFQKEFIFKSTVEFCSVSVGRRALCWRARPVVPLTSLLLLVGWWSL